jgi:hypothetical protein
VPSATIGRVLAARWDTGAELGGGWRRTLRRRTSSTGATDLAMTEPITLDVWGSQGPVDDRSRAVAPRLSVAGSVSIDRLSADVRLSAEQVRALGVGEWEYRLTVTDPATNAPEVLCRGYFLVSGSVDQT